MNKIIDRAPGARRQHRRQVIALRWAAHETADRRWAEQRQRETAWEAAAEEALFPPEGDAMSRWGYDW